VAKKPPERTYMARLLGQLRNGKRRIELPFWTLGERLRLHPDMPEEEAAPSYESWLLAHWEAARHLFRSGFTVRIIRPDGRGAGPAVAEEIPAHGGSAPADAPLVAAAALCSVGGRPACVTVAVQTRDRIMRAAAVWNADGFLALEELLGGADRWLDSLGLSRRLSGKVLIEGGEPFLLDACACGCRGVLVRTSGPDDFAQALEQARRAGRGAGGRPGRQNSDGGGRVFFLNFSEEGFSWRLP
jgi:hypothetical protein